MRLLSGRAIFAMAAFILPAACTTVSFAATSVDVQLWDNGPDMEMPTDLAYAPGVDNTKAPFGIKVSRSSAPAGDVTFNVTNTSKETIHEMIVIELSDPPQPLPYVDGDARVNEDATKDLGEVSELDPGQSGSLTVPLEAGNYLLICNLPGHFAGGMWAEFKVTK